MKHYPSISHIPAYGVEFTAFDKLDGSNIRAEWSAKRSSFYKFGSRRQLIDENDPVLGKSINLIISKFERHLSEIFKNKGHESVVCFFEFYGPSSFAGQHKTDENHDVALIDVAPYKKGIIPPKEFVDSYGHLGIPNVLYHGTMNASFADSVRNGTLPGMTFEGVVCKHLSSNGKMTEMFKVKNDAWIKRLKEVYADDERKFNELR